MAQSREQTIDPMSLAIGNDKKWVEVQQKTFTRWCNIYLSERLMELKDITSDFGDGILFINLLEELSGKKVGKYNKKPKIRAQKLENQLLAFKFLKSFDNIKLVSVGPEDIADGNQKLILGLIWTLILRFQINSGGGSAKSDLLEWVRSKIPEYDINNFTNDWQSGRAISALAEAVEPSGFLNLPEQFSDDAVQNAELGFNKAETEMEIPRLLDAEDMVHNPDEHSNMTYISLFREYEKKRAERLSAEQMERIAEASKCIAYGPGLEGGECLIPTGFTIEARNKFDRRCPCGGFPFKVVMKDPSGKAVLVESVDEENGLVQCSYEPLVRGVHTVGITLEGKHISGSVYNVMIDAEVVDPTQCRVYGPGVEGGEQGVKAPFFIECCNRLGKKIDSPGDVSFKVAVDAPFERIVQIEPPLKTETGVYKASYRPTDPGLHKVHVTTADEVSVGASPFDVNISGIEWGADALQCYAEGPGLESGNSVIHPATYTIHAIGKNGEHVVLKNNPFDSLVTDPEGKTIDASTQNNGDGTFTATYQPDIPGEHKVSTVLRHPFVPLYFDYIKDSPAMVTFIAAAHSGESYAYGPGLTDGLRDTERGTFTIQAVDKHGAPMAQGGDDFAAKVVDPQGNEIPVEIVDQGDGTYAAAYEPNDPGKHVVHVELRGEPIKDAPFSVSIRAGTCPRSCVVENYSFVIQAKDKRGENRDEGGDNFEVVISHESSGESVPGVSVTDNGDGSYTCNYQLKETGKYIVSVLFDGENAAGSPFSVVR
eukprot:TRINITY_DN1558_c0_g1_i1.p1 TRINITY_DN1558_c0_g1~~TRINITY_DN1558_c0_g1_i1.p1  ORF type:complete len:767 (-),score=207.32 TRINITY_DN1558_c0_g1_i1:208-2508(-)